LKLNLKGINFNVWLYFFLFSIGIVFLIGILQLTLIRPYYRNSKIATVSEIADSIQETLIQKPVTTQSALNKVFQLNVDNNVCSIVFNDKGKLIYTADSLGESCIFSQKIKVGEDSFIPNKSGLYLKDKLIENDDSYSLTIVNKKSNQEMIVYGKVIRSNFSNYYLFVNSPLEPVDSIIKFFQEQYFLYTLIVMILSLIVSFLISNRLSKPIIDMNKSAKKLATGDYDVHFNESYFSETNELAGTLNDATEKLSKVDELRKDLIANVSHDIKTPLTMIKAYAEMIQDISGDNKEKREEHLEVIISEVDYLDHLVNDMNTLSKVQSGNYELYEVNFDLSLKIREIVKLNAATIEKHKLNIIENIPDEMVIYADEVKIGQVIYNFLTNAIKNTEENKNIYINAFRIKDRVRVEIVDEGVGISDEELPYIWDRYYKIDKQFVRTQESSGLGLAIVKAILDTHNAKYGVESKKGKGSMFYFELVQENVL
jgi:two-component system sensor histidine kinase ArlS